MTKRGTGSGTGAETAQRAVVVSVMRRLQELGLNSGSSGNASVRVKDGFLITPTGVQPDDLSPESVVSMTLDGDVVGGEGVPSSEWRIHRDIYGHRTDIHAVVHVHSDYATAMACARLSIPSFHYMVAVAGGDSIRCAPYATFGTQALSDAALEALIDRRACLLANHGMITVGDSLDSALALSIQVEGLARQYWLRQLGGVENLSKDEMSVILEKFKTYGRQDR